MIYTKQKIISFILFFVIALFFSINISTVHALTQSTISGGVLNRTVSIIVPSDGSQVVLYEKPDGAFNTFINLRKIGNAPTIYSGASSAGQGNAMTLGTDGFPIIAYYDAGSIYVSKCTNISCSSVTASNMISPPADLSWTDVAIAVPSDGRPVISYYSITSTKIKLVKCANSICSSITSSITIPSSSSYSSMAIGTDGLPIVSYYSSLGSLRVSKCANILCSGLSSTVTIDSAGNVGKYNSINIGNDGFPIIAYYDDTNNYIKIAKCANSTCSLVSSRTPIETGVTRVDSSFAIPPDGLPIVAYIVSTTNLRVAKCANPACSSVSTYHTFPNLNGSKSIAIGADGFPLILTTNLNTLILIKCTDANCTPNPTVSFSSFPSSIPYGDSSTLTWSTTNATTCTASNGWTGAKSTSGSEPLSPTTATSYTLTCTGPGGTTVRNTNIVVTDPIVTITKTGSGLGTVTSSPVGISCGATCSNSFTGGSSITLTATPNAGSTFAGWTGDADCADGSITMIGNKSCTATFNSGLTVTKTGSGLGTVTSSPVGISCGATCSNTFTSTPTWTITTLTDVPFARSGHATVWTGTKMLVWGGRLTSGTQTNTGATYDPLTDSWTSISTIGALSGRANFSQTWTGSELIIWGGSSGGVLNDGARYNPLTDSWTSMSTIGAPIARWRHKAIWTGSKMIVWGGFGNSGYLNDGAIYDPLLNTWTPLPISPLLGRTDFTMIHTGTDMIVWGGLKNGAGVSFNDGARYNLASDSWTLLPASPLSARAQHTAIWTGTDMIIWGGSNNNGARYNLASDSWTLLEASPLSTRSEHTAIWTGTDMIIVGGISGSYASGNAQYKPANGAWTLLPASPITDRIQHTAIWTGTDMIIWGGWFTGGPRNDGARYVPYTNVNLTATQSVGSLFTGWSGACTGTGSCVVTMNTAQTVIANFVLTLLPPTVSTINPTTGNNTGSISITSVTGTDFISGATIRLTKIGETNINCTGFIFTNSTTLSGGSCPITGATTGLWDVVVENPDTQTGTLVGGFTITTTPIPNINPPTPNNGAQGVTIPTTITGTALSGATAVTVSGTGVSATNLIVVNDAQITVDIIISAIASAGARTLTITAPGGTSNTQIFSILAGVDFTMKYSPQSGNFNLSGTPQDSTAGTVYRGGATSANITISYSAPQIVNITPTISPIEPSIVIVMHPSSCTETCITTFTISTGRTTPSGIYAITITGVGGGFTHTTTYTLTVVNTLFDFDFNMRGWAWSDNIGWISFNSQNCDTNFNFVMDVSDTGPTACPSTGTIMQNYGVHLNPITNELSGYAWSQHAGWITFDKTVATVDGLPPTTPFNNPLDPKPYIARFNQSTGQIEGWARATNGISEGWGWIKMSGISLPPSNAPYGIQTATGNAFAGYAWGEDVLGWISFNCINTLVCATSNYKVWLANAQLPNTPPTATNLFTIFPNRCQAGFSPRFSFDYNDNELDQLIRYIIRIYTSSGGLLIDTQTINPTPINSGTQVNYIYNGSVNLSYAKIYYFTVEVMDMAHLN